MIGDDEIRHGGSSALQVHDHINTFLVTSTLELVVEELVDDLQGKARAGDPSAHAEDICIVVAAGKAGTKRVTADSGTTAISG